MQGAGGVARFVTLQPPDWRFDAQQLEEPSAFRRSMVLLNTPLNQRAVSCQEDLELLADFVERYDATVICDGCGSTSSSAVEHKPAFVPSAGRT